MKTEQEIKSRVTPVLDDEGKPKGSNVFLAKDEACIVFSDLYLLVGSTEENPSQTTLLNNALASALIRRSADPAWVDEQLTWLTQQKDVQEIVAKLNEEESEATTVTT